MRGGLAIGTVAICTIFAAMSGISAAATVAMGVIALPSMLKYAYHKDIAIKTIWLSEVGNTSNGVKNGWRDPNGSGISSVAKYLTQAFSHKAT